MLRFITKKGCISIDEVGKKKCWIRCIKPTKKDIKKLSEISDVPRAEFVEAIEEDERPKITQGKYTEIIYRSPMPKNGDIVTQPIFFYFYDKRIITIEKQRDKTLDKYAKLPDKFIYLVIDDINNRFLHHINEIAEDVGIKEAHNENFVEKMYDSSVALSYFNQALLANIEVLNAMRKNKEVSEEQRKYYAELYYDSLQIMDTLRIQRDVISNLFNIQSIMGSDRLNNYMKKITTIGLIIMLPTLVAGMYGMNFQYIPLKEHPYGFYMTILGIMIISLVLVIVFMLADLI